MKKDRDQHQTNKRHISDSEITKLSSFTDKACCFRLTIGFLTTLYLVIMTVVIKYFELHGGLKDLYFLLYLPAVNFVIILIVGRHLLSGVLYPY